MTSTTASSPARKPTSSSPLRTLLVMGGTALVAGFASARFMKRDRLSDDAPGRVARRLGLGFGRYAVSGRTVTINRSRADIYAFLKDFGNIERFARNLEGLEKTAKGQATLSLRPRQDAEGVSVALEIVREEKDRLIAWRSTSGSEMDAEGRVELADAPGERGTAVTVILADKPRGGPLGQLLEKVQGRSPDALIRHDLKRMKMLIETGEIATAERCVRNDERSAAA